MKKFLVITAAIALLFSTYIASYMIIEEKTDGKEETDARTVFKNEDSYLVKEASGKIEIYDTAGREYMSLDVFTFTLPGADREMLEDGFEVTEGEIEGVVMDYTS